MKIALHVLALLAFLAGCATTTSPPGDTGWDPGLDHLDTLVDDVQADDSPAEVDATCPTGETPCGSDCADLDTDPAHCGACEIACTADGPNMDVSCDGGACESECPSQSIVEA